jgi:multiple sugar transport system ATP-binding protein
MASPISLTGIGKTYAGAPRATIADLNLEVKAGEFMVFVGPSGCGKTTLLRMIAGLEDISAGELAFDGRRVNELEPFERGAAMVFQSYALYPHMTVAENLGFGLKMAGVKTAEREAMVARVAETLQLSQLLDRKPKALSGGQRQRVAIGRAIVRSPKVFLFDEPLSNLDANLRVQMRIELARLHRELGTTMIYVTHDQVEAMTLGQRIAVFDAGRIAQVGTPMDLYRRPANRYVAKFIGSPRMNLLPARLGGSGHAVIEGAGSWGLPAPGADWSRLTHVGVRAEDLELQPDSDDTAGVRAQVQLVEQLGDSTLVHLQVAGVEGNLTARLTGSSERWPAGQLVRLHSAPEKIHLFDAQGLALR